MHMSNYPTPSHLLCPCHLQFFFLYERSIVHESNLLNYFIHDSCGRAKFHTNRIHRFIWFFFFFFPFLLSINCQDFLSNDKWNFFVGQEKARYIESQVKTGCDSVLKFCAEFLEDLGEIVSETSVMYDVDFEKCVESEVGSPIEEETLTPAELDEFVSLGKGPNSTTLSNGGHDDVNQGEACSVLINKSDSISEELTECDYPEKEEEIHNNHSDACSASSAYQFASGILVLLCFHFFTSRCICILVLLCFHVSSMTAFFIHVTEILINCYHGSQLQIALECLSWVVSSENGHKQHINDCWTLFCHQ